MREFFRGWKRKVGCVTLVAACVFAAGWIRSLIVCDVVYPPSGEVFELWSAKGAILVVTSDSSRMPGASTSFQWVSRLASEMRFVHESENFGCRWRFQFAQSGVCEFSTEDVRFTIFKMWYGLIVIPLTLLSSWLLFSKPRLAKSVPSSEPQAL